MQEINAMVGVNGSGKSSVFKVLKKWHQTFEGQISINGESVSNLSGKQLSGLVSYLNESVSLFSGTVEENVALFRKCREDQLKTALEEAHVELSPNREIADEGRNVSSGEQRRIEIARSLLGNAPILVFDEVVSTLDVETAYEIEQHVLNLKNKTVIFISHNFSGKLIKKYDEILVMHKGQLIAAGHYNTLIHTCPYFKNICEIKFGTLPNEN